MPSKRTNDSVDRILQDLNQQQTAAGVQDTVTDHQVDEILRSVGISTTPLRGTPEQDHRIAFSGLDDLENFEDFRSAAPRTAQPTRTTPAQPAPNTERPAQTVRPAPQKAAPVQSVPQPEPQAEPQKDPGDTTGTLGDTTRTGIIKGFLLKMAPDADAANTDALNQGKNQFQKFFRDSVAVVPDENGKIREPGRKKRGLFGLKSAEDTDEFVPINVSLGAGAQQNQPAEEPPLEEEQEEYFPDREQEPAAPQTSKKRGLFGNLFGGRDSVTEEIVIPEERQEEPPMVYRATRQPEPEAEEPEEPQGDTVENVWRSKYTRTPVAPAPVSEPEGDTMEMLRGIKKAVRSTPASAGNTTTIYRKKRNTVEFTPGQKVRKAPPAQAMPEPPAGEPVGEPINLPSRQPVNSGFTMQLGAMDASPVDSTQDFMAAYNAVRPRQASRRAETQSTVQTPSVQQPMETAVPQDTTRAESAQYAGRDPYADTQVVGLPQQDSLLARREPDDVDELVDTLTGKIRLTPQAPAHTGFTQDLGGGSQAAPAHSGFTQDLGGPSQPVSGHSGFTQDLGGGTPAAPAHSGFTQNLGGEMGQADVSTGFTQNLNGAEPAEPGTASFVKDIAQAINTGSVSDRTQRFDTAAARLTASLEDEVEQQERRASRRARVGKRVKDAIRLGGAADDEQADVSAQPFETAEIPAIRRHEYERAEDAPTVRRELAQDVLYYTTASLATGVFAAVLLVLGLLAAALPVLPGPLADPMVYPAVALVLLLVAGSICWRTMLAGVLGLAKRPSPDSLAILPLIGAVIQCIVLLAGQLYTEEITLMAGPAVLVLCLNTIGKRMNACTIQANFRLVSAKVEHSVAYRLKDAGALRAMTTGLAEPHPNVLINRPTQIFRSFLTNSAAAGTSDKNQQQFAWLAGACALVAMLITLIRTKDGAMAVTVLASVLCLGAPLAGTLLSALPARMMQRSAAQVGAVIPGWRDIRQLGRINVIQVTARDLFPTGCVTLSGIKPVKPEHIDLAIVYAASILAEAGPTLREVFLGMLGENRNLLAQVDDRETIYGKGYVGWINKRRVLVGNRALMQDYGVKVPSLEYEQHHTVNQRRVIYLAVSGKMFAMFQVAYQRDPDTAVVLESLRRTGLSLVVDCDDFNCDVQLLEAAYSLPAGSVKVLSAAERKTLDPAVAWLPESEGNMLHLGSFASFVGGLEAAAGAAEGEHKSSVLVSASVLFGCVLGVLLTLTGGLTSLPLLALVLYQAAWCVLAMIFPLIQRY